MPDRSSVVEDDSILVIDARRPPPFGADILELWEYRELVWFLILRDIKSKYKSATLGIIWVIFQPLVTAATLSACLAKTGVLPSDNIPYPLLSFSGLVIWQYVANVTASAIGGAMSISYLINRVYFPKAVIPVTISIVPLLDLIVALTLFFVVLLFTGKLFPDRIFYAIPSLFLIYLSALSAGIWFCVLSLRFHDFRHLAGLVTQVWMFGSPVFYALSPMPPLQRMLIALNPLSTGITGFRWSIFSQASEPQYQYISWLAVLALLLSGSYVLHRLSTTLADNT
ncbi:MAG: ABC transporter permease [Candidatus Obscuribacterales bacterium]|nr:ABC transporter permease [Candidatus Obscuribacterales bacterium]